MKKSFNKFLAVVLSFVLLIAVVPAELLLAQAEGIIASGTVTATVSWNINTSGILKITGDGAMANYSWSNYQPWYSKKDLIKQIEIGDGISSIGSSAFQYLTNVESVTIGQSVTSIGKNAFMGANKITDIVIPDRVSFIGEAAFSSCSSVVSLYIGADLSQIGASAFGFSSAFKSVEVSSENTTYQSNDNCMIEVSSGKLVLGTSSSIIPDDGSVSVIGSRAFRYCDDLTDIYIPASVEKIDYDAFYYCHNIETITVADNNEYYSGKGNCLVELSSGILFLGCPNSVIPDDGTVNSIYYGAFRYAGAPENIVIPDSVTSIGEYAFYQCSGIMSIVFGKGLKQIGNFAFSYCKNITEIALPDSMEKIGDSAFCGCGIEKADLGKNLTEIYGRAFSDTKLTSIIIPEKITVIELSTFSSTPLQNIVFPEGLVEIGQDAFGDCTKLEEIDLPDNLEKIGYAAFETCINLKSIHIPKKVNLIMNRAFCNCDSLETITADPDNETYYSKGNCLIEKNTNDIVLGCKTSIIPTDSNVNRIAYCAFAAHINNLTISIPENITEIENEAFFYQSNLSVYIYNPSCNIYDSNNTIDFYNNIIYGYEGSTAQAYAEKYNRKFVPITPCEHYLQLTKGDTIEFGSYPKSVVNDQVLIEELNIKASDKEWKSLDYYSGNDIVGSMIKGDYVNIATLNITEKNTELSDLIHIAPRFHIINPLPQGAIIIISIKTVT